MWECDYGKEPLDIRLLVLRFLRKSPVILLAALLGAVCIGGPYFLRKVTFGPAKEYEAVTDFYIDYAVQESGEEYTYFNQTTWTQLITDDVFTDKILANMSETKLSKQELREYLYATMLSDTRIVTTTVTTNDPVLTMKIEKALLRAMEEFGREQKEIAGVRILQEPEEASLVTADVRTFRACMLGAVIFVFVTVFYLLIYFVLDEGIYIPATFERRYGVPMLGTICSVELPVLAKKLFSGEGTFCEPVLVAADGTVMLEQVREALAEAGIKAVLDENLNEIFSKLNEGRTSETDDHGKRGKETDRQAEILTKEDFEGLENRKLLLVVKARAHNGKRIEKLLDFCRKCDWKVSAALLWEADERLIRAYEMPEHMLLAWRRLRKNME